MSEREPNGGVAEEPGWVPVRSEEKPPSAVQALQQEVATLAAGVAALTERIERLEGEPGTSSDSINERRAALVQEAPFSASAYDREVVVSHTGRRFAAVFTSEERGVLLQALNDAADAARRRQG